MTNNRNQHTVPQVYLKRFANNASQLYVFDKHTKSSFGPTNVRNIGAERDYYNVPAPSETTDFDTQIVDKILQASESEFGILLDKITENLRTRITDKQKEHLAFHLALQIMRTREFRANYIELSKMFLQEISEAYLKSQDIEANVQVSIKFEAVAHGQMVLGSPLLSRLTSFLSNCIWFFGINETEQPLYTSDNPIVKKNHLPSKLRVDDGWLSPGIEITFPITPTIILNIHSRKMYEVSNLTKKLADDLDGNLIKLERENVTYYNSLQVVSSYRQVYSKSQDFELAKKICENNPEICKLDRASWKKIKNGDK
ncbi:DUF4238 domain-containing protein [Candidatus Leptofilum sp.]|uniref:DUF4238 domain-containing protein n=1 Tax=Candidatus Leptofilum sp. TaxID=3241576 RepID=UPI003B59BC75